MTPCMCGDSECPSCGTAQGTITRAKLRRVTFAYMLMTDGKESVFQISQGNLTKRHTINLNAKSTVDVARETVAGGIVGIHYTLASKYQTSDAPAWEALRQS